VFRTFFQEFGGVPISLVRIYAMLLLLAVGNESLRLVVGPRWRTFIENRSAGAVVKRDTSGMVTSQNYLSISLKETERFWFVM
jgi:hypothetical protein